MTISYLKNRITSIYALFEKIKIIFEFLEKRIHIKH